MAIRLLPDPEHELSWRNPFVLTVDGVLSADECLQQIERIEALGLEPAPITTAHGALLRPDVRNNDRVMLDDPDFAALLLERVRSQVPPVVESSWQLAGANERLRFYRYQPGQRFAPHFDGSFRRSDDELSFLTFLVYLNSCDGGGETKLTDLELEVRPVEGCGLLFNHFLLHEGAVVTRGFKYVVRTDLMYRRIGVS